jgi:predicted TPR repeat methyltransferase
MNIRKVVAELKNTDFKLVMDFGCGSDPVSAVLRQEGRKVIGVDVDEHGAGCAQKVLSDVRQVEMVAEFGELAQEASYRKPSLALFMNSLEHVPFEDALYLIANTKLFFTAIVAFIPEGSVGDNSWDSGPHKHKHHWTLQDVFHAFELSYTVVNYLPNYHGEGKGAFFVIWCADAYILAQIAERVLTLKEV